MSRVKERTRTRVNRVSILDLIDAITKIPTTPKCLFSFVFPSRVYSITKPKFNRLFTPSCLLYLFQNDVHKTALYAARMPRIQNPAFIRIFTFTFICIFTFHVLRSSPGYAACVKKPYCRRVLRPRCYFVEYASLVGLSRRAWSSAGSALSDGSPTTGRTALTSHSGPPHDVRVRG